MMKDEIILFETKDRSITLPVQVTAETVCYLYHQKKDFMSVPYEPKDVE